MTIQPVLLDVTLNYLQLIMIPLFAVAAFYGFQRGWREEAITSVGLLVSLLIFANNRGANLFASLINRITDAFRVFISVLFGSGNAEPRTTITPENFPTFQLISFVIAVGLSYLVGSAIGKRGEITRFGQGLGALIGALNAYIVLSKLYDFWLQRQAAGSDLPLDEPTQILITPAPVTNDLKSNLPTIFALLFLIILIITFIRLPKIRQ